MPKHTPCNIHFYKSNTKKRELQQIGFFGNHFYYEAYMRHSAGPKKQRYDTFSATLSHFTHKSMP